MGKKKGGTVGKFGGQKREPELRVGNPRPVKNKTGGGTRQEGWWGNGAGHQFKD